MDEQSRTTLSGDDGAMRDESIGITQHSEKSEPLAALIDMDRQLHLGGGLTTQSAPELPGVVRSGMSSVARQVANLVAPGSEAKHVPILGQRQRTMRAAAHSGSAAVYMSILGQDFEGEEVVQTPASPLRSGRGPSLLHVSTMDNDAGVEDEDRRFEEPAMYAARVPGFVRRVYLPWAMASQAAMARMVPRTDAADPLSTTTTPSSGGALPVQIEGSLVRIPDLIHGHPPMKLPSKLVYIASCARPACPRVPLPQVVFGLDAASLSLRQRPLQDADALHLAIALRDGWSRCIAVDLAECCLSDWAVAAICDGLLNNTDIRALDFSGNPLGPRGQHALLRLIAVNSSLRHLNLSRCGLADAFVEALFDLVCARKSEVPRVPFLRWSEHGSGAVKARGDDIDPTARRSSVAANALAFSPSRLLSKRLQLGGALTRKAREAEARASFGQVERIMPGRKRLGESVTVQTAGGSPSPKRLPAMGAADPRSLLPATSLLYGTPGALMAPLREQARGVTLAGRQMRAGRASQGGAVGLSEESGAPPVAVVDSQSDPIRFLVSLASPILPLDDDDGGIDRAPPPATPELLSSQSVTDLPRTPLLAAAAASVERLERERMKKKRSRAKLAGGAVMASVPSHHDLLMEALEQGPRNLVEAASRSIEALFPPEHCTLSPSKGSTMALRASGSTASVPTLFPDEIHTTDGNLWRKMMGELVLPHGVREALRLTVSGHRPGEKATDVSENPPPTCVAALGPYYGNPPVLEQGNRHLRSLVLAGNTGITRASAHLLAHMVGVDFEAKHVRPASSILDLTLSWCPIGSGARLIIEAVGMPPQKLTALDLSFVGVDEAADPRLPRVLHDALASNGSLTRLELSHNSMGPECGEALAQALLTNESLKTLLVGFNPLGVSACARILLAAMSHSELEEVGLENCFTMVSGDAGGRATLTGGALSLKLGGKPLSGASAAEALAEARKNATKALIDEALGVADHASEDPVSRLWGESAVQALYDRMWRIRQLKGGMLVTLEWPPSPRSFSGATDVFMASCLGLPGSSEPAEGSFEALIRQRLSKRFRVGRVFGLDQVDAVRVLALENSLVAPPDEELGEGDSALPQLARMPGVAGEIGVSRLPMYSATWAQNRRLRRDGVGFHRLDPLAWAPEISIFADRPRECDAHAFVDTADHLMEAFECDWELVRLERLIKSPSSLEEIKAVLRAAYPLIKETFRAYGLSNGATDPFDLSFSELRLLWEDLGLFEAFGGSRSQKEAVLLVCFSASNYDAAPSAFDKNVALARAEFLEVIVRLSLQVLLSRKERRDPTRQVDAVTRFLRELLLPQLRRVLDTRSSQLALLAAGTDVVSAVGRPGMPITPGGALVGLISTAVPACTPAPTPALSPDSASTPSSVLSDDPYDDGGAGDDTDLAMAAEEAAVPKSPSFDPHGRSLFSRSKASDEKMVLRPVDVAVPGLHFGKRKHAIRHLAVMRARAFGLAKVGAVLQRTELVPEDAVVESISTSRPRGRAARAVADMEARVRVAEAARKPRPAPLWAGEADVVSNAFRQLWMLREDVAILLEAHRSALSALFRVFSGRWQHADDGRRLMSLDEWLDMLGDAGIVPDFATDVEAVASYVWSSMTVRDESVRALEAVRRAHRKLGAQIVDRSDQHTYTEMLESVCRLAACATGATVVAGADQACKDAVLVAVAEVRRRVTRRRERSRARARVSQHPDEAGAAASLHDEGTDTLSPRALETRRKLTEAVVTGVGMGRFDSGGQAQAHMASPDGKQTLATSTGMSTARQVVGARGGLADSNGYLLGQGMRGGGKRPALAMIEEDLQAVEDHTQRKVLLEYLERIEWLVRKLTKALENRFNGARAPVPRLVLESPIVGFGSRSGTGRTSATGRASGTGRALLEAKLSGRPGSRGGNDRLRRAVQGRYAAENR
jgi:hypothetical protein